MRLLFIADGRSPIATNWMHYFIDQGHEVHLASTFPCEPDLELVSLTVIPVALSGMKSIGNGGKRGRKPKQHGLWGASRIKLRMALRQWLGPTTLPGAANRLRQVIAEVQPELIHAMRIPFEGMLAALAVGTDDDIGSPLLLSVWGNDFTLHAPATPLMRYFTRRVMEQVDGLHTDCYRDLRLARSWGYPQEKPVAVLPGGGGVQPEIFYPPSVAEVKAREKSPLIINPRGFRAYVRNDTFFRAIPLVLNSHPEVRFFCPSMAGEVQAEEWIDALGIHSAVTLLPKRSRPEMAAFFRKTLVTVSPTEHDGTPNTLLEAMACGCFPIAGDIESLREWIRSGINGLLVSPSDPQALAESIIMVLETPDLRRQAAEINLRLIAERSTYLQVMEEAERFYKNLIKRSR